MNQMLLALLVKEQLLNKKKKTCRSKSVGFFILYFSLTTFFKAALALKAGTLLAGISIVSPVLGLRPVLASLVRTSKVPKPFKEILSPAFKTSVKVSKKALIAASDSFFC